MRARHPLLLAPLTVALSLPTACSDSNAEAPGNTEDDVPAVEKEDLSTYDEALDVAERYCDSGKTDYHGDWYPNDDGDLGYSTITGDVEWVEDGDSVTLIHEEQGTSADAGAENLLKFELTWTGPTEPGESVRFSGRITGGEYGEFAIICASGVARVQNVIDEIEYTTLSIERFGETNEVGECDGLELPIEGQASACLSPARY